jgi:hypothetical protein
MARQFFIYLLLSTLVIIFARYAHILVLYIDTLYAWLNVKLTPVFSQSDTGILIRKILVLTLLPVAIAALPAAFYWIIKRREMPHFIAMTWIIWVVIVLSSILIR